MDFVKSINLDESFSFSFRNVDSPLQFFSDDGEETFFEIDLDSTQGTDGFEFRISFSSLPRSEFSVLGPGDDLRAEDQSLVVQSFEFPTMGSSSSGIPTVSVTALEASSPEELTESSKPRNPTGRKTVKAKLSAPKGKVKISPVMESPNTGGNSDSPVENRQVVEEGNRPQMLASRRPFKITATFNGGMMKFLIKFRSGKFISTLMSLLKPYNIFPHQFFRGKTQKNQETFWKHPRLSNPFQKWFALINTTYLDDIDDPTGRENVKAQAKAITDYSSQGGLGGRKLGSNHRVLGAKSGSTACKAVSIRGDVFRAKTSVDERESSVSAAIAHCKRSFGGYVYR